VSFAEFMTEQVAEIEASGMAPEDWIAANAEMFRQAHPVDEQPIEE
jgi:hypothetical protein